jgi:hypothetical protein
MPAAVQRLFDILDRFGRGGEEALHAPRFAFAFGHLIKLRLGLLDLLLGIDRLAGVERPFNQPATDADQFAQQGEVVNLLGEIARADQALRRLRSV